MIDKRLNQEFVTDRIIALADQYTIRLSRLGVRVYVTDEHWCMYAGDVVYRRTVLLPAFYDSKEIDKWFDSFVGAGMLSITGALLTVI